jgi:hypothetical protein
MKEDRSNLSAPSDSRNARFETYESSFPADGKNVHLIGASHSFTTDESEDDEIVIESKLLNGGQSHDRDSSQPFRSSLRGGGDQQTRVNLLAPFTADEETLKREIILEQNSDGSAVEPFGQRSVPILGLICTLTLGKTKFPYMRIASIFFMVLDGKISVLRNIVALPSHYH